MNAIKQERGTVTQDWLAFSSLGSATSTNSIPMYLFLNGLLEWEQGCSANYIDTNDKRGSVRAQPIDFWLEKSLRLIENYRKYTLDWDGADTPAPASGLLETAECLIGLFAALPSEFRPQLSLDPLGRPSLAARDDHRYLHLTVEGPNLITWFSCKNTQENFEDEVAFDGTRLPEALTELMR